MSRESSRRGRKPGRMPARVVVSRRLETPASTTSNATGKREIAGEFVTGLLIAALLTGANVFVEHSRFGGDVRMFTYQQVHRWLPHRESDVVVVDLTQVPADEQRTSVRSREHLLEAARALARCRVSAIGLDYDLSPPDPADAAFLDGLMAIRDGTPGVPAVPVFVGVRTYPASPAGGWLGDKRYDVLAAQVQGNGLEAGGERQIDAPTVYTSLRSADGRYEIDGLSAALTKAVRGSVPSAAARMSHFWTHNVEPYESAQLGTSILLDTSGLDVLVRDRVQIGTYGGVTPTPLQCGQTIESPANADRLRGRIALVGAADPKHPMDMTMRVPGANKAVPGVYLHAAGVETMRNGYLYLATTLGVIVIDLVIAAALLGAIAYVKLRALSRGRRVRHPLTLTIVFGLICLAIAVYGGPIAALLFRIVWDGSAFVAAAILIHLLIDVVLHEQKHRRAADPAADARTV